MIVPTSTFLATVLKVVYGIPLTEDHDQYVATFHLSAEGISQGLAPGKYIFEVFPFLKDVPKWVPGFAWQGDFERWREAVQDVKDGPYARAKEAMVGLSSLLSHASGIALKTHQGPWRKFRLHPRQNVGGGRKC